MAGFAEPRFHLIGKRYTSLMNGADERRKRLAQTLRDNLRRRKGQSRENADMASKEPEDKAKPE